MSFKSYKFKSSLVKRKPIAFCGSNEKKKKKLTSRFIQGERTVIIPKHTVRISEASETYNSVVLLLYYVDVTVHVAYPVRGGEVTQICL